MSKGTEKLQKLLSNLKKLPLQRKAYWLRELKKVTAVRELGAEYVPESERHKGIGAPAGIGLSPIPSYASTSDWMLDLANWLDRKYESVSKGIPDSDEVMLNIANRVDKIYTGVANEAAKVPSMIGKGASDLVSPLTGGDYMPYVIGAAAVLAAAYYGRQAFGRR